MRHLLLVLALCACQDSKQASKQQPAPVAPIKPEDAAVPTPPTAAPASDLTALAKAHNNAALELWARLPTGNLAYSPASVTIALAMTWAGAKGETAEEMRKVLKFEGPQEQVLSRWGEASKSLTDTARDFKLALANRLFGANNYTFDTVFFDINMKTFGARLDVMDFAKEPEPSREKINTWVAKQTEQRIKNLIPPRAIDPDTRLVIVNAIYFLAEWAEPFEPRATTPQPFHVSAKQQKQVPTMRRSEDFLYASGNGASLIELPYKGGSASMYLLVPDAIDGLAGVEAKLGDTLRTLQGKLAQTRVALSLPRFTIDPAAPLDLAKILQDAGMKRAFDRKLADFTGIAKPANPDDRLFISAVFHKAFVKVDEKGTEAAAATAVVMTRAGGMPPKAIELKADRPFLFLIVDRASGLILFMGRVADPS